MQTITTSQIEALQVEAGAHGDEKMAATCSRALAGSKRALATVRRVLREAQAQDC